MIRSFLFILFFSAIALPSKAQYSKISEHISLKDFMETAKENHVKSVTRLIGDGAYEKHPYKHFFTKEGFLAQWHTGSNIYTYENDSIGRVVKSYTFKYPKTEEYSHYTVRSLDTLGNPVKSEHFYGSGERHHFSEDFSRIEGDYLYLTHVEAGKDSSVIRIKVDTVNNLNVSDYISYRDGNIFEVDTYISTFDEERRKLTDEKLYYDEALMAWVEEHPEDGEKLYYSYDARLELIASGKLDSSLFERTVNESYSYYENGWIKRAKDYSEIREYEYDDRGFPKRVTKISDREEVEAIIEFLYNKDGLLEKEITTKPDGTVKEVLNYHYTFW